MKLPTEAELIELENWVLGLDYWLHGHLKAAVECNMPTDEAIERIKLLIALARDPSQLLRYVGLDDTLDPAMQSQRTTNPEPSPSARPKLVKGKTVPHKRHKR